MKDSTIFNIHQLYRGLDKDGRILTEILEEFQITEDTFLKKEVLVFLGRVSVRFPNGEKRSQFCERVLGAFFVIVEGMVFFAPSMVEGTTCNIYGFVQRNTEKDGSGSSYSLKRYKIKGQTQHGGLWIYKSENLTPFMKEDHPDCEAVVCYGSGVYPICSLGIDKLRWQTMNGWFEKWLPK